MSAARSDTDGLDRLGEPLSPGAAVRGSPLDD